MSKVLLVSACALAILVLAAAPVAAGVLGASKLSGAITLEFGDNSETCPLNIVVRIDEYPDNSAGRRVLVSWDAHDARDGAPPSSEGLHTAQSLLGQPVEGPIGSCSHVQQVEPFRDLGSSITHIDDDAVFTDTAISGWFDFISWHDGQYWMSIRDATGVHNGNPTDLHLYGWLTVDG